MFLQVRQGMTDEASSQCFNLLEFEQNADLMMIGNYLQNYVNEELVFLQIIQTHC